MSHENLYAYGMHLITRNKNIIEQTLIWKRWSPAQVFEISLLCVIILQYHYPHKDLPTTLLAALSTEQVVEGQRDQVYQHRRTLQQDAATTWNLCIGNNKVPSCVLVQVVLLLHRSHCIKIDIDIISAVTLHISKHQRGHKSNLIWTSKCEHKCRHHFRR